MRLGCLRPEAGNFVLFVGLKVSFEPVPLVGVIVTALIGQDVSSNSV
jgi:hypothetical protein